MGDFVTIGVMGGQQIASAGKIIHAPQRPAVSGRRGQRGDPARHHDDDHFVADRIVDIRKEL
jgi:hypothetical protein